MQKVRETGSGFIAQMHLQQGRKLDGGNTRTYCMTAWFRQNFLLKYAKLSEIPHFKQIAVYKEYRSLATLKTI